MPTTPPSRRSSRQPSELSILAVLPSVPSHANQLRAGMSFCRGRNRRANGDGRRHEIRGRQLDGLFPRGPWQSPVISCLTGGDCPPLSSAGCKLPEAPGRSEATGREAQMHCSRWRRTALGPGLVDPPAGRGLEQSGDQKVSRGLVVSVAPRRHPVRRQPMRASRLRGSAS